MIKQGILLFAIFFCTLSVFGQNKDSQVAAQYLRDGSYDKAAELYEKLFDKQPALYYTPYLQSLIGKKDLDKAEKIAKKAVKSNDRDASFLVDLGYVYSLKEDKNKSKQQYEKAIKKVADDPQQASQIANAFIQRNELDMAIQVYLKARASINYKYHFELADLYSKKQDIESMMGEYFEILGENTSFLQNIQNYLQTSLATDPDGKKSDKIRGMLLKKIQEYPDKNVYSELLTWLFMQQKDFLSAFMQLKAIDKRQRENGERLMSLAEICLTNEDYDVAVKCYDYVVSKGSSTENYVNARIGLLNALNKKITSSSSYTQEDLKKLETDYQAAFKELGRNAGTAPLIRGLAHLQAFYLGQLDEAIKSLNEAIALPNINPKFKAECKIELGDILLLKGEIWDATLFYSQVDLDFKGAPIGEEAKLKNAKLYYYTGDFPFAQSMLDVLKSGTSHLIANDAMALSLLITDNIDLSDSNTTPLFMYSRADLLEYQNKDEEAQKTLDSISKEYPEHSISDEVLYKKAEIYKKKGNFTEAAKLLGEVIEKYPGDILADDAMFDLAMLYENQLSDKEKAKNLYQEILNKYPASIFVVEARKRFRLLRGDNVN